MFSLYRALINNIDKSFCSHDTVKKPVFPSWFRGSRPSDTTTSVAHPLLNTTNFGNTHQTQAAMPVFKSKAVIDAECTRGLALTNRILEVVSLFLAPNDIGRMTSVSRHWENAMQSNLVWFAQAQGAGVNIHPDIQISLRRHQSLIDRRQHPFTETAPYLDRQHKPEGFDRELLQLISEYHVPEVQQPTKRIFSHPNPVIAFGRNEWIRCGLGDPGETPTLPSNIHKRLQGPCPLVPRQRMEQTHILMLIPATVTRMVNGEPVTLPLTFNNLVELVKTSSPEMNEVFKWAFLSEQIPNDCREQSGLKSRWILISTIAYAGNSIQLKRLGYKLPSLLDAATTLCMQKLFHNAPLAHNLNARDYVLCCEGPLKDRLMIQNKLPIEVMFACGGNGSEGLIGMQDVG